MYTEHFWGNEMLWVFYMKCRYCFYFDLVIWTHCLIVAVLDETFKTVDIIDNK